MSQKSNKLPSVTILSTIRICELQIKSHLLVHFWIRKLSKNVMCLLKKN